MNRTLNRNEFYSTVKTLVDDTFAFQDTKLCEDMVQSHIPARYYRYIQLFNRRAVGKTYTLTRLANDFYPTMAVFANRNLLTRAVYHCAEYQYYPTNPKCAFTTQDILSRGFIPTLGQGDMPPRFKLGIIDDALKLRWELSERQTDEMREIVFLYCDVVLELG